ncbi:Ser-Thr-rich glycosyl-phosphatidyl-inositol-anchored membrane family-domain-containing protein [Aspergillus varians]
MRSFIRFAMSTLLLDSLAAAMSIVEPTANSTYAAGSTITVNWTTVDTDPSFFSLYLWNFVSWPPSYVALAIDIPTAEQSATVQIPCDTNAEWGYQLSAINGTNSYIIYAQGERFTVSAPTDSSACVDSVPVPSSSATATTATCAAATVYVTVTPTPSSPHHNHHHHHSFASPSLPPASVATSSSSTEYTKPGLVPKTIGWREDYDHPVTVDHPPVPTAAPEPEEEVVGSTKSAFVTTVTTTIGVLAPAGDARCPAFRTYTV